MQIEVPISLYFGLPQGQRADMKVVGLASVAFVDAIQHVVTAIDPFTEVRIEIETGTKGSLSLNSIVEFVRGSQNAKLAIRTAIVTLILHIGWNTFDWTQEKVMDWLASAEAKPITSGMSKAEVIDLAREVARGAARGVAEAQMRPVFVYADRDSVIESVGVSTGNRVPSSVVPRSAFPDRIKPVLSEATMPQREEVSRVRATVISPVLVESSRRWRFRTNQGEFTAHMGDDDFEDGLLSGRLHIPMQSGVELDMDLQAVEEFDGEVWRVTDRTVTKVYGASVPPTDTPLWPASGGKQKP